MSEGMPAAPTSAPAEGSAPASTESVNTEPKSTESSSESPVKNDPPTSTTDKGAPESAKKEDEEKKESSEKKDKEGEPTEAEKEKKREEARRRYKMKVNGQEVEREYTDEEIQRRLQLQEAADEKFQKASKMVKQAEQFLAALKNDPIKVLSHPELGIDIKQLAEEYLTEDVRKSMMSEEERELEELRQYKQQQEELRQQQEEQRTKTEEEKRLEHARQEQAKRYSEGIAGALQESGLPRDPFIVKQVAATMASAIKKGYEIDPITAVDIVKEKFQNDIMSLSSTMDVESFLNFIGPDLARKIRRHDIAQLKKKQSENTPAAVAEKTDPLKKPEGRPEADKVRWSDFMEKKRKEFLG